MAELIQVAIEKIDDSGEIVKRKLVSFTEITKPECSLILEK